MEISSCVISALSNFLFYEFFLKSLKFYHQIVYDDNGKNVLYTCEYLKMIKF